jgi:ParB family chromosome partitioning protein
MRLLQLPPEAQELLGAGRLGISQALWILGAPAANRLSLARAAVAERLSLRELKRRVSRLRPSRKAPTDANTRAAAERMRAAVGSKVEIARSRAGGTVRIAFRDENELNRIYEYIVTRR